MVFPDGERSAGAVGPESPDRVAEGIKDQDFGVVFERQQERVGGDGGAVLEQNAAHLVGGKLLNDVVIGAAEVWDGHFEKAVLYTESGSKGLQMDFHNVAFVVKIAVKNCLRGFIRVLVIGKWTARRPGLLMWILGGDTAKVPDAAICRLKKCIFPDKFKI